LVRGQTTESGFAPEGVPNVLLILIDDMGFGQSSAFGGPINMPTVEALANEALRFNQFHTTALCSPTRTALLSGRNHHMNNMGGIRGLGRSARGTKPAPWVLWRELFPQRISRFLLTQSR